MIPYYILKTSNFNTDKESYFCPVQNPIDGIIINPPSTQFKKHPHQIITNYVKYDLTCETLVKKKARALGYEDPFLEFILIADETFYYSQKSDIVILNAKKDVYSKFYQDFKKDYTYSFEKIEVDFKKIIKDRRSLGINGIWLGELPDINLNSLLLLGNNVEDSNQYDQLITAGAKIKNITIIYDFNNEQEKIMITKEGGIILYHHKKETDALVLVEDVYNKLLKF